MSVSSQKQTRAVQEAMSALPPKADMCGATTDVRYGPKADIRQCDNAAHSITSFANREHDDGGPHVDPKRSRSLEMSAGTISIENSSAWAELFARDNCDPRRINAL